jgi:hypothetical protein
LRDQSDKEALTEALRKPGPEEELKNEEDIGRDLSQKSALESLKAMERLTVRRLVSKVVKPRERS